jgi:hypothetical protein
MRLVPGTQAAPTGCPRRGRATTMQPCHARVTSKGDARLLLDDGEPMTDALPLPRRRIPMVAMPLLLVIVLAILWTGFWLFARWQAQTRIDAWREHEARQGRVYTCGSQQVAGYPFRIEVRCSDAVVELRTLQPPLTIKLKDIVSVAQVYTPTLLISEFTGPLTVAESGQPAAFVADWRLAQASVRGLPAAPERLSVTMDGFTLERAAPSGAQLLMSASHSEIHARMDPSSTPADPVVDLALRLTGATAPALGPYATRPLDADIATVVRGIRDIAPKPLATRLREFQAANGRLDITRARLQQGETIGVVSGSMALSRSGRADGALRLTVAGLDQFINAQGGLEKLIPGLKLPDNAGSTNSIDRLAGSLDRLLPGLGGAVKSRAGSLVGLLGEPADLEGKQAVSFPVRFNDGVAFFGPFQIGQTGPLY